MITGNPSCAMLIRLDETKIASVIIVRFIKVIDFEFIAKVFQPLDSTCNIYH